MAISKEQMRWIVLVPLLVFSITAVMPSITASIIGINIFGLTLGQIFGILGLVGSWFVWKKAI